MGHTELHRVGVDAAPLGAGRTGVGNYVQTLLEPMVRQNPAVQFFLYSNEEIVFPDYPNVHRRTAVPKMRGPLWQNLQLPRAIKDDAIQVFWGSNGLVPLMPSRKMAQVVTVHDLAHRFAPETQEPLVRWNRRIFQRLSVLRAQRVIAVSGATGADIQKHYGRPVDEVIHPVVSPRFGPVDPDQAKAVVEKYHLPDPFLLTVATLEPRKNIAKLVKACLNCHAAGLAVPLLVLAGGRGWLDSDLARTVDQAEKDGFVRRLGYVPAEDLPSLYASCKAFIFPSIYEGFGMPLLEAQLCGAGVIHGSHASMVEAAGGVGVSVVPTVENLQKVLAEVTSGVCRLAIRDRATVHNSADESSRRLWATLLAAHADIL